MSLWTDALTIPPAAALNGAASSAAQRQAAAAAQRDVVPLVYGEDRIGGLLLNALPAADGPSTLLVQQLWCYACDSINDLRLNDQLPPGSAVVAHYNGTQTTVDPALAAAFAAQGRSYTQTLNGFAHSVIRVPTRLFSGALNFSARIRGRRVYDRRLDSTAGGSGPQRLNDPTTWTWSPVPALCLADLLSNPVYGAGEAVDWSSVAIAADANDQTVGGTEPRRRLGWSLTKATELPLVVAALRAHAGCFTLPGATGIRLVPDRDEAPAASYAHAAGEIASLDPLRISDLGSAPTAVEIIYTDTSTIPWRDASAVASLVGAGSTLPWRLSQVRMPGVQRYSQAMREARERLNKLRLQAMTTTVELFDVGIRHDEGDLIALSHPAGLSATPMRVTAVSMPGPGRWRLGVARHDANAYDDSVHTAPLPAPLVTDVTPPIDNVQSLRAELAPSGIRLFWAANDQPIYASTEIRRGTNWALSTEADRLWAGAADSFVWMWPEPGAYTLMARHFDVFGAGSAVVALFNITVGSNGTVAITATWTTSAGAPASWSSAFGAAQWSGGAGSILLGTNGLAPGSAAQVLTVPVATTTYPKAGSYGPVLVDGVAFTPAVDCTLEVTAIVQAEAYGSTGTEWGASYIGLACVQASALTDDALDPSNGSWRFPSADVANRDKTQALTGMSLSRASYTLTGRFPVVAGQAYRTGAFFRGSAPDFGITFGARIFVAPEVAATLIKR